MGLFDWCIRYPPDDDRFYAIFLTIGRRQRRHVEHFRMETIEQQLVAEFHVPFIDVHERYIQRGSVHKAS